MGVFIRSAAAVSPQQTFGKTSLFSDFNEYYTNRLTCIEPDYKTLIDPKLIRRMGRIIKMSVAAALNCLNNAGITIPDAIITGTAYGCLEDSGTFLTSMVELDEEPLAPTAFVHSTHNTIAAQIALLIKCQGYNNTFVNGGASFEHALTDALMLLAGNEAQNVLVGGMDELTDISYSILRRFGIFKKSAGLNLDIFNPGTSGTIAGEGAAFFMLSNTPSGADLAKIDGVSTFYKPDDLAETEKFINEFLSQRNLAACDIDLLITGNNGDTKNDSLYNRLQLSVFKDIPAICYKHLCGEYPTSAAFALWLGAKIIKNKAIPVCFSLKKQLKTSKNTQKTRINTVLICNNYQNIHHSLILISSC